MIIIREKKQPMAETAVNEKINNFIKVIESGVASEMTVSLGMRVKRNENMKPFVDAGGKVAVVLAYILGVVKGIKLYTASDLTTDEQLYLSKANDYLSKAFVFSS